MISFWKKIRKKMSLCLVAIFKNESHIMEEWLNHYRRQGVDQFFLIDNGSTDQDQYQKILCDFPVPLRLVVDPTKHQQTEMYNKYFFEETKKFEWVLVCDLDEFVYARKGHATIKDYLATLDASVSSVHIQWKLFGSNGFDSVEKPQPSLVVPAFTRRIFYDKNIEQGGYQGIIWEESTRKKYCYTKCIARSRFLKRLHIHMHLTSPSNRITTDSNVSSLIHEKYCEFAEISEAILADSCLHLNHYPIQSYEWFMRVKAVRGDVGFLVNEHVRNAKYFRDYDINDVEDLELASKLDST